MTVLLQFWFLQSLLAHAAPAPRMQKCADNYYNQSEYVCYGDRTLCPIVDDTIYYPCADACFDPKWYKCSNKTLVQIDHDYVPLNKYKRPSRSAASRLSRTRPAPPKAASAATKTTSIASKIAPVARKSAAAAPMGTSSSFFKKNTVPPELPEPPEPLEPSEPSELLETLELSEPLEPSKPSEPSEPLELLELLEASKAPEAQLQSEPTSIAIQTGPDLYNSTSEVQAPSVESMKPTRINDIAVHPPGSGLEWFDEFDGATLDASKWNIIEGDGCPGLCNWGNDEQQVYSGEQLQIGNSFLTISATKRNNTWYSGKITTKGKFERAFGRFEARIKLPLMQGAFPAFWLLASSENWPATGEIDIIEYQSAWAPIIARSSVHVQTAPAGLTVHDEHAPLAAFLDDNFHIFAVQWDSDRLQFFRDGVFVGEYRNSTKNFADFPFIQAYHIILNLAVGPGFGSQPLGEEPMQMIVDWVRVYS